MIKINPKYKSLFKNDKRYHIISGGRAKKGWGGLDL